MSLSFLIKSRAHLIRLLLLNTLQLYALLKILAIVKINDTFKTFKNCSPQALKTLKNSKIFVW